MSVITGQECLVVNCLRLFLLLLSGLFRRNMNWFWKSAGLWLLVTIQCGKFSNILPCFGALSSILGFLAEHFLGEVSRPASVAQILLLGMAVESKHFIRLRSLLPWLRRHYLASLTLTVVHRVLLRKVVSMATSVFFLRLHSVDVLNFRSQRFILRPLVDVICVHL